MAGAMQLPMPDKARSNCGSGKSVRDSTSTNPWRSIGVTGVSPVGEWPGAYPVGRPSTPPSGLQHIIARAPKGAQPIICWRPAGGGLRGGLRRPRV